MGTSKRRRPVAPELLLLEQGDLPRMIKPVLRDPVKHVVNRVVSQILAGNPL
jgi:hypothetical protein